MFQRATALASPSRFFWLSTFGAIRDAGVDGIVIQASPIFHRDAAQLAALALQRHLPTICEWRAMASDGCLIGYGPDAAELRSWSPGDVRFWRVKPT